MKIIFWGSSGFAVPILKSLVKAGFEVKLAITQPDASKGRFLRLEAPPAAKTAKELGLPLYQPEQLKNDEVIEKLKEADASVHVVAAYGKLIPESLLTLPKFGMVNVHPSLLPKYRGPSPIQSVILNGEQETGVSLMVLDKEMDHGSLLAQKAIPLARNITTPELEQILSNLSAEFLVEILPRYLVGKIKPQEQDHAQTTFCKMLKKEDGKINWDEPAEIIERKIRALQPWPGTYTFYKENGQEQLLKIIKAIVIDGKLKLEIVQPAGKKPMTFEDFLRGHPGFVFK